MRTEEREGEKFFFLFRLYKQKPLQVGCNENVRDRMRYFNKWFNKSLSRRQRGEIYHLAAGGIFTLYFRCKYIKVHSPGVEEKWSKIVFVQNPRTCP